MNFRRKMNIARPDVVERQAVNAEKSSLAMRLRGLRDIAGMDQEDVAEASGLDLTMIEQMEALTGDVPAQRLVDRYVDAVG